MKQESVLSAHPVSDDMRALIAETRGHRAPAPGDGAVRLRVGQPGLGLRLARQRRRALRLRAPAALVSDRAARARRHRATDQRRSGHQRLGPAQDAGPAARFQSHAAGMAALAHRLSGGRTLGAAPARWPRSSRWCAAITITCPWPARTCASTCWARSCATRNTCTCCGRCWRRAGSGRARRAAHALRAGERDGDRPGAAGRAQRLAGGEDAGGRGRHQPALAGPARLHPARAGVGAGACPVAGDRPDLARLDRYLREAVLHFDAAPA